MAQNFQSANQAEKAKARYQQVIADYPDTMCAAIARRKLQDMK